MTTEQAQKLQKFTVIRDKRVRHLFATVIKVTPDTVEVTLGWGIISNIRFDQMQDWEIY